MWMQVIHGKNLFNSVTADEFISNKNILNDFGINTNEFNAGMMYSLRVFYLNLILNIKKLIRRIKK